MEILRNNWEIICFVHASGIFLRNGDFQLLLRQSYSKGIPKNKGWGTRWYSE
jgi:hypothetical protein